MTWNPVIDGVLHRPVTTNVLPRIGESVRLPITGPDNEQDEAVYRVVDVRHYVAYKNNPSFEDVHLEAVSMT